MARPTSGSPLTLPEVRVMHAFGRYPRLTVNQATLAAGYAPTARTHAAEALFYLTDKQFKREYLVKRRVPDDGTNITPHMESYWSPLQAGLTYLRKAGYDTLPRDKHDHQRSAWLLNHDLAINDVLIAYERFAKRHGGEATVVHDEYLARSPIAIPEMRTPEGKPYQLHGDGWIELSVGGMEYRFWLEVDRGTEKAYQFKPKIEAIVRYAMTVSDLPLTIPVVETKSERKLAERVVWTEEQLRAMGMDEWGALFRFAMIDSVSDPDAFFTQDRWVLPFTHEEVPLLPSLP